MVIFRKRIKRRMVNALYGLLYRSTGGRISRGAGRQLLILTTTGRKSGKGRHTPLTYIADGDNLILVASNGGRDRDPDWCLNLRANPRATVRVKRRRMAVVAEIAGLQERERLWPMFVGLNSVYETYQKRTKRQIPIIVLRSQDSASSP